MTAIGRAFTRGVLLELAKWLIIGTFVAFTAQYTLNALGYGWDVTDDEAGGQHSGVRLRIDHGTGCQYLESRAGSLTPRLDRGGKPFCGQVRP